MSGFLPFSHALLSHSAHPFFPVVAANQSMRSTTNLLIINLAAADLLFVVFCVPFTAVDYVLPEWPFGEYWCKFVRDVVCQKKKLHSPLMGSWQTSKQLRREAASRLLMPPFLLPFSFRQVQYMIVVTAHASAYTLVLMSLDRFLAVVHPITSMSIRTERNASL